MDSKGRITSHLQGILNRTINFLEAGIKPIYVFDGKPHVLKRGVLDERNVIRNMAKEEWEHALKEGDVEKAKMKAQQSSRLTREMVEDSKALLGYLGIPFVNSPSEGEAQASYIVKKGEAWAVGSQDFDSLLFGASTLVRNLTITGKRKLPKRQVWIDVEPEVIIFGSTLNALNITREQMVDLAILIGTDFNYGIRGIGSKKALKLVRDFGSLEKIIENKRYIIPNYEDIRNIFLTPDVTDNYTIIWKSPSRENVLKLLCYEFEFSTVRVNSAMDRLTTLQDINAQRNLDEFQ
jgi:flap endonuclease-1